MLPLELREMMEIEVRVRPVVDLGGGRRCVPFEGGTFVGRDGLAGSLLEGESTGSGSGTTGCSRSMRTTRS